MRNRNGGFAVSPVLVGAVTVLVVIVAVFLAYNANNGLPFVSTYNLKARVPDADALVKANEVRIGGARVGVVKSVVPVQLKNGKVEAELSLSLDKSAEPIPNDSTILVRPKSPLGLKYLQITPGTSKTGFKAGETIPVRYATPEPGDIDKFFDMFNEPTRKAIQRNLAGFGNALAGRGPQLNEAIGALRGLVEQGEPAAANLAAPSTNFAGFFKGLEALSATVAPVAQQQASMFRRPRPDLHRLRPRLASLHHGNDRKSPADAGNGERRTAADQPLPSRHRALLHRVEAGGEGARRNLAGDRRIAARRRPGA